MSSKKSLIKGALAKSNKSPVKSLPSPIKSSVRSGLSRSLSPSRLFNGIVELAPASSNRSDPEYHANPDEISLGSSEDAEQAGPISDPHLLIEEIHDYVSRSYLPSPSPLSPFLVPPQSIPGNPILSFRSAILYPTSRTIWR